MGASWFAKLRTELSKGVAFGTAQSISAEKIAAYRTDICDFSEAKPVTSVVDTFNTVSEIVGIDLLNAKK